MTLNIKSRVETIGVVGAGTMGQGIIQVFAQSGFEVLACDAINGAVEKALGRISSFLTKSVEKGKLDESSKRQTLERIKLCDGLRDFEGADIAIEAVIESEQVKEQVFRELDEVLAPGKILASNTSSISINSLAAVTKRPAQFIGMHFFNPVPLMGLVEIVVGEKTDRDTIDAVCALARAIGKEPLQCKDSPGFVSNRVGMPMINEAAVCLHEGVATREAIDGIMKLGFNHPMGPLALADLIGIDVCLFIMEVLHRDLKDDKYRPCPLLKQMVDQGRLGKKSGRGFYEYP